MGTTWGRIMKYDTTLKDLLWRGAPALLHQLTGSTAVHLDPTEFPATRNRHPDFVARLASGILFHLELQGDPDERMDWRVLEYYGPISERNRGEPVVQMVLCLTDAAAKSMSGEINHPNLRFRYTVVSAQSLDATPLLTSAHPDDNVLAILCGSDDMRQRVRDILDRLSALTDNERGDAVTRLLVLAGLRKAVPLVMAEVAAMGIRIDIEGNEFLKSVFTQGEAKGEATGRLKGGADLLLKQLVRRFGPLPDRARQAVLAADTDQLEVWGQSIFEARSLDDLLDQRASH